MLRIFSLLLLSAFSSTAQSAPFFPADLVPEVELSAQAMTYYRPSLSVVLPEGDDIAWEVFRRRLVSNMNIAGTLEILPPDSVEGLDRLELTSTSKQAFLSDVVRYDLHIRQSTDSLAWANWSIDLSRENALEKAEELAAEILVMMTGFSAPFDTRLLFIEDNQKGGALVVSDFFGEHLQVLTSSDIPKFSPTFAPDGHGIAFVSFRESSGADIFLGDTRGGAVKLLLGGESSETAPAFSPDGNWVACAATVSGNTDIYLLPVQGGRPKRLTFSRGIDTNPSFSPDGRGIVFSSDRSGRLQLYSMGVDGLAEERLAFLPAACDCPAWSPDGEWIVFTLRESKGYQLHMIRPDGTDLTRLSDQPGNHFDPCWSPDAQLLAFCYKGDIWISAADGSRRRRLSRQGGTCPAWASAPVTQLN